jgi:hypothetical protein
LGGLEALVAPVKMISEHHARRRQGDGVLSGAVNEGIAQLMLQLLYLPTHRGLRHIQFLRRLGKTETVCHLEKILHL